MGTLEREERLGESGGTMANMGWMAIYGVVPSSSIPVNFGIGRVIGYLNIYPIDLVSFDWLRLVDEVI